MRTWSPERNIQATLDAIDRAVSRKRRRAPISDSQSAIDPVREASHKLSE
jgi:hypothetical protein